ncbi:hypothetical protein PHYBOEH_008686 [Phytophthora boehmeriae]|uniref:BZIP domain-containing protein n=1 Tax=Phytophthora boehmeriae TaxID=109152 RepID=A0A8T1W2M4_9STRA|nr:hypothetical protein PHYBOEH_008686 [Phytophthora boehmeriae]
MPASRASQPRRKRVAIHLPSDLEVRLNAKELKKMKNRIASARVRERSQENYQKLLEQLDFYKQRCEVLEEVIAMCDGCSSLCGAQHSEIELLPATKPRALAVESEDLLLDEMECVALHDLLHGSVDK